MSDREQCLPYKGGAADRVVRDRGGRVIAAAAAVKEEDFVRPCVGWGFGAITRAEILPMSGED